MLILVSLLVRVVILRRLLFGIIRRWSRRLLGSRVRATLVGLLLLILLIRRLRVTGILRRVARRSVRVVIG